MAASGALRRTASRICALVVMLAVLGSAANLVMASRAAASIDATTTNNATCPADSQPTDAQPAGTQPAAEGEIDRIGSDPTGLQRRTPRKTKGVTAQHEPAVTGWALLARPSTPDVAPVAPDQRQPNAVLRLAWGLRGPPATLADRPSRLAARR